MNRKNRGANPLNVVVGTAAATLIGGAVIQQFNLPANERTWHGTIAGIPYDFRFPTVERLRNTFWNQDTSRILVPQAFGLGWTLNFYPLVHPKPAVS